MTGSESDNVVFEAVEGLECRRGETAKLTALKFWEVRDIFWTFTSGEVADAASYIGWEKGGEGCRKV
jgi:hypothetical protein